MMIFAGFAVVWCLLTSRGGAAIQPKHPQPQQTGKTAYAPYQPTFQPPQEDAHLEPFIKQPSGNFIRNQPRNEIEFDLQIGKPDAGWKGARKISGKTSKKPDQWQLPLDELISHLQSPTNPLNEWVQKDPANPLFSIILKKLLNIRKIWKEGLLNKIIRVDMNQMSDMTLFEMEFMYTMPKTKTPSQCFADFQAFNGILYLGSAKCKKQEIQHEEEGTWIKQDPQDPKWDLLVSMALKKNYVRKTLERIKNIKTKQTPNKTMVKATFFVQKVKKRSKPTSCKTTFSLVKDGPYLKIEVDTIKCDDDDISKSRNPKILAEEKRLLKNPAKIVYSDEDSDKELIYHLSIQASRKKQQTSTAGILQKL